MTLSVGLYRAVIKWGGKFRMEATFCLPGKKYFSSSSGRGRKGRGRGGGEGREKGKRKILKAASRLG